MIPASAEQWTQLRADVGRLVARRLPAGADVEDVVQDVLLRVWRHGDELREDERFGGWLARLVHSAMADHFRDRQRHPLARFDPETTEAGAAPTEDQPDARALIAAVLRPFVARLPDLYREAVVLSELEGLAHPVIAERLGLSISGVKSRVQRGRAQLREMLERCCEIALDARRGPVSCEIRPDGVVPEGCCRTATCPPPPAASAPARRGRRWSPSA
jgi:RNA polymerase sigma-70 factor (ECF subfamily)